MSQAGHDVPGLLHALLGVYAVFKGWVAGGVEPPG